MLAPERSSGVPGRGAVVSPAPATVSRRRRRVRVDGRAVSTFVMALPMLLAFTLFAWWPLLRAGVLSVQRSNLVDAPSFVGLENFRAVLADPLLWTAVKNTAWFVFLALVFGFPIPLVLAVMMSELRRNRGLYSALAYLPVVIPPVASILLWQRFFDASPTGTFNTILGWFGLGPWPWIQDPTWAMPSIVLLATWSNAGATVIIYLAALTSVRAELYEAAEVDGASLLRKIWHITLPQLRTVLFVTLMLQIVGTFQLFTEPFLLTVGRTGRLDRVDPAADLPLRVRRRGRCQLRRGDGAQHHARRVPRRVHGGVLPGHPRRGATDERAAIERLARAAAR